MTVIIPSLVGFFVVTGVILTLVSAIGVVRLPDVYTRNHAASKSATLGVMCVLLGTFIHFYAVEGQFNSRVLLSIAFIFLTAPVAGHLISRAAYYSGVKLWKGSNHDDLKQKIEARQRSNE
ncbi:monovalent cation/H(+) antiporter subunit G [Bacillus fonticola]|uniref:monovalent cation/H(+) antiporter subunit G n=1 Tax=Bacillus fonticola TaxID=2728853 RepID=UPI0014738CD4|nr:monovalent cation/H(+) antiporter subunit G [Bacillus fonticola]